MIELLKLFVQVVEEQSFTGTARLLGISQPAVSNQIRALEDKLGAKLITRRGKGLILSQEGEIAWRQAKRIIEEWDELLDGIGAISTEIAGIVKIGASNIPGEYLLPSRLASFQRKNPKVHLKLLIGDSLTMANKILDHDVDFAVVGSAFDNERLASEFWLEDELLLVLDNNHPLAQSAIIYPTDLVKYSLIIREGGSGHRRALEEQLSQHGLQLENFQISLEAGSIEAVKNAVRAGFGFSFISRSALEVSMEGLITKTIQDMTLRRGLYLITHRNKPLSGAAKACYEFLVQQNNE